MRDIRLKKKKKKISHLATAMFRRVLGEARKCRYLIRWKYLGRRAYVSFLRETDAKESPSLGFRHFNGRRKHDSRTDPASLGDVAYETEYYYKQVRRFFAKLEQLSRQRKANCESRTGSC